MPSLEPSFVSGVVIARTMGTVYLSTDPFAGHSVFHTQRIHGGVTDVIHNGKPEMHSSIKQMSGK